MNTIIFILCFLCSPLLAGFDRTDLKTLIKQSDLKDSDVLMVWKDGELLHAKDREKTRKYSIQSVTKSLTALTTSCIVRDRPEVLDQPGLFKEWENTPKAPITLRMLLSMTSGMIDPEDPWGQHDYYKHAADQPLTHAPGTKFSYANISPMIVGKWMKESTGHHFSYHIKACLFDALGISDWSIGKDGKGNEVVAGGIRILAKDLFKVGIMLTQEGVFEGQQLYTQDQIAELRTDPLLDNNGYGLGFWRWGKNIYYAEGYLGQFLIMVPSEKLVVLRLRNRSSMRGTQDNIENWFSELPGLISQLLK